MQRLSKYIPTNAAIKQYVVKHNEVSSLHLASEQLEARDSEGVWREEK